MGEFIVHAIYIMSNLGRFEIMLSECGEIAKVRSTYGSNKPKVSEWLAIAYVYDNDEKEWVPIIDPLGYNIPLNLIVRLS